MTRIIHLSDLHFGTEREGVVALLLEDIKQLHADVIVVSGDVTQRAKAGQFQTGKKFFEEIGTKVVCVPGNHDIPLYNILVRLMAPFSRYKKWISPDLCTHFIKDNLAILGINSATPYKPMGGYVRQKQLDLVTEFFQYLADDVIKIVVMHHNLIFSKRHKIINDAEKIINYFASCNVNLVLCGHIHSPNIELLKRNYLKHNMYVITAGTAISTRTMVPNSFNIIDFEKRQFKLIVRTLVDDKFANTSEVCHPL